jgi:hypothetical protein
MCWRHARCLLTRSSRSWLLWYGKSTVVANLIFGAHHRRAAARSRRLPHSVCPLRRAVNWAAPHGAAAWRVHAWRTSACQSVL